MKFSNPRILGFYAGILAGIVAGIAFTFFRFLDSITGLYAYLGMPYVVSFDMITSVLGYSVGTQGIFGGIFGIIYSILYVGIPSKRIKKGIIFGLLIGLLTDYAFGSFYLLEFLFIGNEYYFTEFLGWAISAFTAWVPYGIVLGWLYERWK